MGGKGMGGMEGGRVMSAEHIVGDRVIPGWPSQPLISSCLAFNAFSLVNNNINIDVLQTVRAKTSEYLTFQELTGSKIEKSEISNVKTITNLTF